MTLRPVTGHVGWQIDLDGFVQIDSVPYSQASVDDLDPATGAPLNQETIYVRRALVRLQAHEDAMFGSLELQGDNVAGPTARLLGAYVGYELPTRDADRRLVPGAVRRRGAGQRSRPCVPRSADLGAGAFSGQLRRRRDGARLVRARAVGGRVDRRGAERRSPVERARSDVELRRDRPARHEDRRPEQAPDRRRRLRAHRHRASSRHRADQGAGRVGRREHGRDRRGQRAPGDPRDRRRAVADVPSRRGRRRRRRALVPARARRRRGVLRGSDRRRTSIAA